MIFTWLEQTLPSSLREKYDQAWKSMDNADDNGGDDNGTNFKLFFNEWRHWKSAIIQWIVWPQTKTFNPNENNVNALQKLSHAALEHEVRTPTAVKKRTAANN